MSKDNTKTETKSSIQVEGKVLNTCKSDIVVITDKGAKIVCRPSGKMRQNQINILEGDRVIVEVSEYDMTRGRIIRRIK